MKTLLTKVWGISATIYSMSHESIPINDRIQLVQLTPDHAQEVFDLTEANRAYLDEFLPWPKFVKEVEDSKEHIEETLSNRENGTSFSYGIQYDSSLIGNISIRNLIDESLLPEIGYWIAEDYSGKGIASAATTAITQFAFHTLGLQKVIIRANPENIASNKVAENAGYTFVGQEPDDEEILNIWMKLQSHL